MEAWDRGDRVTYGHVCPKPLGLKHVPTGMKVFGMLFPYGEKPEGWMGDLYRNDISTIEHTSGWSLSFRYGRGWVMRRPANYPGGYDRIVLGKVAKSNCWEEHVINAWRVADWIVNHGIPPAWAEGSGDDRR